MSRISVTRRELQRAYNSHCGAYVKIGGEQCQLTCLLVLFYAVECGLKAVWLKQNKLNETSSCGEQFDKFNHNINVILSHLHVSRDLHLPNRSKISSPKRNGQRYVDSGQLNQAWRYGCLLDDDGLFEEKLKKIINWIRGELS